MPVDFLEESPSGQTVAFRPDIDFQEEAPQKTIADFVAEPQTELTETSPITSGALPSVKGDLSRRFPTTEQETVRQQVPETDEALRIGEQPATIPKFGKEGTILRGASEVIAGLGEWALNKPEEFAATFTPLAPAVALRYAPDIAQQFISDVQSGAKGDRQALGRALTMGGLIGIPKAAKVAREKWLLSGKPREAVPTSDEVAREGMRSDQEGELMTQPSPRSEPTLPIEPEKVLPGASVDFKEITGKEPTTKGVENASEISKATTLGRDVLRVGEESRRENEAGMPVNESQPGVRTQAEGGIREELTHRITVGDLKGQGIAGYSPFTGEVKLDKSSIEKLSPEERAAVVRHELAHKIETEEELWNQTDTFLWDLWEKDRNHPIWDFSGEKTGRVGMRNDVSPEIIAELYSEHYPKGTFTVKERPVAYEWEGEDIQLPKEYPIPKPLMEVLERIEEKLGIWKKKQQRESNKKKKTDGVRGNENEGIAGTSTKEEVGSEKWEKSGVIQRNAEGDFERIENNEVIDTASDPTELIGNWHEGNAGYSTRVRQVSPDRYELDLAEPINTEYPVHQLIPFDPNAKPKESLPASVPKVARETATPTQSKLFSPEALQTDPEKTLSLTPGPSSPFGLGRQIKSFLKKHFTVEGHIPKEVYEGPKATMEGELGSLQSNIKFRHREFMDALAETYGLSKLEIAGGGSRRIPVQAVQLMDEYLKGRVANPAVIPPRIRGVLDTMRAEITGKSNEMIDMLEAQRNRLPANSAKAKSLTELIDKIRGNLDIYVHRSYKFFDSKKPAPDWYADLNAGIRARAEDLLIQNSTTPITREQAQSLLLNWLSDLKEGGGFGSGKLGSKDLSIFMKRKVIDPEIRAVLGEYHSPLVNYAKSMTKMGEWMAKQKFLEETKRIGMGRFLFEEDSAPPGFNTRIAGEGSDTMSPLNGLRTTQEIADAFKEFYQASNSGLLARAYLTVNAWTKIMATSHSMMTQARNLLSRPWMSGMAGHWQLGKLGRSVKAIYEDYAGSDKTWEAYIQKLNKLQVLGDTARSGELRAILKDAALQDVGPADIASWSAMRALKQVAYKTPMDIYRMSDELGNIFGFENERAIQSKIHPTWTPEQLDAEAARIVRSIYPVYSETPPAVKQFRKVPLVGPFVTFPYQMFRTTWNGFAKSFYEIRSANPVERAVGYKRLVSQMGTLAATWALAETSKQLLGITTQQEDDFRRFQPPWGKNSKYLFTAKDSKTGEMQAINLSYMDPYSYISDPMVALAANLRSKRDFWDTFAEVGIESLRPWVSEQMLTKALIEARNGKTDSGREIVNQTDSPYDAAIKRIDHVLKTALPGTVQRIQRRILPAIRNEQPVYGRKLEVVPEIVREITGTGIEKFDFKSGLAFRAKEFTDKDRASESVFHQVVSRTQTTTPEDLVTAYKESDNRRFEIWKEIRQDFLAAVRNGVSVQEAKKTMEARGVTRKDANWIARGSYDPMMISDSSRKRARERNRTLPLKEINAYRQSRINASLD